MANLNKLKLLKEKIESLDKFRPPSIENSYGESPEEILILISPSLDP